MDGFVPSLGMGIAIFDHSRYNHTFVAGHSRLQDRVGAGRIRARLRASALWRHQAVCRRRAARPDGERRSLAGVVDSRRAWPRWGRARASATTTGGAACRSTPRCALIRRSRPSLRGAASITTRSPTESDFSLWNDDEPFRPNVAAAEGRLNAIVIGASADSHGFERESLEASYRRHQLETPFGERLNDPDWKRDPRPIWRVDWTSEISEPDAFGSDFDFRRHIVTGRARVLLSEHQNFGVRAIRGWSGGELPPQRLFAIGGIGSVHGYEFKEATGDALSLLNLEYEVGWRGGLKAIGFFDAGRVRVADGAQFAVAERRGLRHRPRRHARRFRLPDRRHSQLAQGAPAVRSDVLIPGYRPRRRLRSSAGHAGRGARGAGQGCARARVGRDDDDRAARRAPGSFQENARWRRHPAPARAGRALGEPAGVGPAGLSGDRPRLPVQAGVDRRPVDHRSVRRHDHLPRAARDRCPSWWISATPTA